MTTTQSLIVGLTGRTYSASATHEKIFNDAKRRYATYVEKGLAVEKAGYADPICDAFEACDLSDDDAELALSLLRKFYADKAQTELETMERILESCEDVTGKA